MSICPFCRAELRDVDLESGQCPNCGRKLPSDESPQHPAAKDDSASKEEPPEGDEADTADEERAGETLEAGPLFVSPPAEEEAQAADDGPSGQTLPGESRPTPPPSEDEGGTADEALSGKSLPGGARPTPPPSEDERGAASDREVAETVDSDRFTPERLSAVWGGAIDSDDDPNMSIKGKLHAAVAESKLVIPSRGIRRPRQQQPVRADYDLIELRGEGGMGKVYEARQTSINRTVAVKMLKQEGTSKKQLREAFLSEAVVTGDLEHPNIVPIYDLGLSESGELFYSMKYLPGADWSGTIRENSTEENLDILLKVTDAIAFAHSRGVIHRDLKPENVVLNDFGEVLVADWGLALSLSRSGGSSRGGTPAYMAPEMAEGDTRHIGVHSDVYLLGAVLFEIITGKPPHPGKKVLPCLAAAARNIIRSTDKSGELLDVAMQAMATAGEDRYATVADFQAAIREYQSHSESILLARRAREDLAEAGQSEDYDAYSRALFGYREAVELWDGNTTAKSGVSQATLAYAGSALRKGDYDLGASLLDIDDPQHAEVHQRIQAAARERDSRQRRLQTFKRAGVVVVATFLVAITAALFWALTAEADLADKVVELAGTNKKLETTIGERDDTIVQRDEANKQLTITIGERDDTIVQRDEANKQLKITVGERDDTIVQRDKANTDLQESRDKEEYGAYIARIGLASAKIEENAFDRAKSVLAGCPKALRHWEWRRLMHLCRQQFPEVNAGQPIDAVAFSPDGSRFVTGGWGGTAIVWDTETREQVVSIVTGAQDVFAVAFSPDGKHVATGTNGRPDYVSIWDAATGNPVGTLRGSDDSTGHTDAVLSAQYSTDGKRLLTSSYDDTARLWDLDTKQQLHVFRGHSGWVWSAAFSADNTQVVTASHDGSVMVWSAETYEAKRPFYGHHGPVYDAVFSPDGQYVASVGYDRRVLIWEPDEIEMFDYDALLLEEPSPPSNDLPPYQPKELQGHTAGIRSVRFSPDGKRILTGGNDNTVRIWDTASGKLLKTLRGHGGWVTSCRFHPQFAEGKTWLLSGSHDKHAKIWDFDGYEEVRVFRGHVLGGHRDAVLGAAFSGDGKRIVSASGDRAAKTWNATTGEELLTFDEGHDFLASTAIFFPGGKRLLTAAYDNTTRIWDAGQGTELRRLDETGARAAVALSRDGKWILTGSSDNKAKLFNAQTGKLQLSLLGPEDPDVEITAVAISPKQPLLFTGDAIGTCRLFNQQTGEQIWKAAKKHTREITAAVFLPDGKTILTASPDKSVGRFDVATGEEPRNLVIIHPREGVSSMALSHDGTRLLTVSLDRTIWAQDVKQGEKEVNVSFATVRLWDVDTAKQIGELPIGDEVVNSVAFSPDGKLAVTTNARITELENGKYKMLRTPKESVRLWDVRTMQQVGDGPFLDLNLPKVGGSAWSAVFQPSDVEGVSGGSVLTIGGNDARLWNLQTGDKIMEFSPHDAVASAHFSPDAASIVTGSWDRTAKIWDSQTGRSKFKLEGTHGGLVNHVVFSPDGSKILTASDDKTAGLWDAINGEKLGEFGPHEDKVRSAVFSSDGKLVLTASDDKTAQIFNVDTYQPVGEPMRHEQAVLCAAFSADHNADKLVVTGGEDNRAIVWNTETAKEVALLEGHTAGVTSVAFSADGKRVVTGSRDHTAKVWELKRGEELLTLRGHTDQVTSVAFSPPDAAEESILTGSRDGTLILYLTTGATAAEETGRTPSDDGRTEGVAQPAPMQ